MENCDWNLICAIVGALGGIIAIYVFLRGGIEKMIQRQTETLHKDIMGVKEDIKEIKENIQEIREDSRRTNERMDRLYQMFVDLLSSKTVPKTNTNP